jgi:competence protein ComEA
MSNRWLCNTFLAAFCCTLFLVAPTWAMVDANHAPPHDLEAIKGIGPGTRDRILRARQAQPFRNWQDFIERVPGIGPARAQKLSAQGLTIQGQPYGAPSAPSKPNGHTGAAGLGAPGPMPSGVPWQRGEPRSPPPLPR